MLCILRIVATSQMHPTHARKTFPCFDEPAIKAVFYMTLIHPPGTVALSNGIETGQCCPHVSKKEKKGSISINPHYYLACNQTCVTNRQNLFRVVRALSYQSSISKLLDSRTSNIIKLQINVVNIKQRKLTLSSK